ncbi:MAG: hypothetical protein R3E97_23745 [Candidatus Eisenbacteria bacterium]
MGDPRNDLAEIVWSHGPDRDLPLTEDHVVAKAEAGSGETFEVTEVVPPGWTLEIRIPNGQTLTIVDPTTR